MIVLTTFELDEYVFGALRAGASGFLLKDIDPPELLDAVRVVAGGRGAARAAPHAAADRGVRRPGAGAAPRRDDAALEELTPREREVLTLVGRGLSNARDRRDARALPADREDARRAAVQKLDARDRAQLVVTAYETGLVVAGRRDA